MPGLGRLSPVLQISANDTDHGVSSTVTHNDKIQDDPGTTIASAAEAPLFHARVDPERRPRTQTHVVEYVPGDTSLDFVSRDEALIGLVDSTKNHDSRPIYDGTNLLSHGRTNRYGGTGFSDDGRSLTPDPHSSEAETEHLAMSEDEEPSHEYHQEQAIEADLGVGEFSRALPEDDIPADLDALSETDSEPGSESSLPSALSKSVVDTKQDGSEEEEEEEGEVLDDHLEANDNARLDYDDNNDDEDDEDDLYSIEPDIYNITSTRRTVVEDDDEIEIEIDDEEDEADGHQSVLPAASASTGPSLALPTALAVDASSTALHGINLFAEPNRKRSRESSPNEVLKNAKRLAPRKVQAELDSDEEEDVAILPGKVDLIVAHDLHNKQDHSREPGAAAADTQLTQLQPQIPDSPAVDEDEIEEEEEVEEEVQDDNEREERNRYRQAAMELLRQIEADLTKLRAKLYEERCQQLDNEIALAQAGSHPLLIQKRNQNQLRHSGRVQRAEVLRQSRMLEADLVYRARKFSAHSQFAQDKQKLRASLLSKTSAEWFQIHREKRVIDMAVPEYGYMVSDRKSTQLKHRREHDAEVALLVGLKKYVGFPAAPLISTASAKEIETDLTAMGIVRNSGNSSRETQRTSYASHAHITNLPSATSASHSNHHGHTAHTHTAHPPAHGKTHHRKKTALKAKNVAADNADHHSQGQHTHSRNPSPQVAPRIALHNHPHHGETQSRKFSNLPATFNLAKEPDRRLAQQSEANPQDSARDRVSFSSQAQQQLQSSPYYRDNASLLAAASFGQKQAQNMPNILRQDTPENKPKHQLPNLSNIANGNHHTSLEYAGSSAGKSGFSGQFWNSKAQDSSRIPAPAMSSNSAFNATLSQPGSSASYIPPTRAYSPAGAPQNPIYKTGQGPSNHSQHSSGKSYQPPAHHPTSTREHSPQSTSFQSKPQLGSPNESRAMFGIPPRSQ